VISARPYKVFLCVSDEVWDRIDYVEQNPLKEHLPAQRWAFVADYDNFPFHKQTTSRQIAQAKAQARSRRQSRSGPR